MVASFTQLLSKRYRGKLDQDADEFIGFAVDGATRMQSLINDLLAFSRVGTRGRALGPTDCKVIFEQALANLQTAIEESRARVTPGPLPTVPGDDIQLVQLFQNLIANALKFGGASPRLSRIRRRKTRVTAGCLRSGTTASASPGTPGTDLYDFPTPAPPLRLSRHRHRPGHL